MKKKVFFFIFIFIFFISISLFFNAKDVFSAPPYPGVWKITRMGFKSTKSLMRISPEATLKIKASVPSTGELKCVAILAEFRDKTFQVKIDGKQYPVKEYFKELMFGRGDKIYYKFPSFSEYWEINSKGKLKITGDVFGPYMLPHTLSDYSCGFKNSGRLYCGLGGGANSIISDLVYLADGDVNFSEYDGDGDGSVDCFMVIHSGEGAETQEYEMEDSKCCDIWSHAFQAYVPTSDGVTIKSAFIGAGISNVFPYGNMGLMAHEFGHLLGLPDLYDTASQGLQSCGVGPYSLMGYGLYKGDREQGFPPGTLPANLSPWEKIFLGWATSHTPDGEFCDTLSPTSSSDYFLRLLGYGYDQKEYFLVEFRKRENFDSDFPSEGVLIWRIDENVVERYISSNQINRYECYPGCGNECGEQKVEGKFITCQNHYGIKIEIPHLVGGKPTTDPWRFERTDIREDSIACLKSYPTDFWKEGQEFPDSYTSAFGYKGIGHKVVISVFKITEGGGINVATNNRGEKIFRAGPKISVNSFYDWVSPGGIYEVPVLIEGVPPIYVEIISPEGAMLKKGEQKLEEAFLGSRSEEIYIQWEAHEKEGEVRFKVLASNCIDKIQNEWGVKVQNSGNTVSDKPIDSQGTSEPLGCSCSAVDDNKTQAKTKLLSIFICYIPLFVYIFHHKRRMKRKSFLLKT